MNYLFLFIACWLAYPCLAADAAKNSCPNILIILADDLGYGDLRCYNAESKVLTAGFSSAHRTTHIETDIEAVPLTKARALPAMFARQQMQTY